MAGTAPGTSFLNNTSLKIATLIAREKNMRGIIQEFKDITNSRELLEARPSPFLTIFIYLMVGLILAIVIWAYLGEMDIPVKATGVVRPSQKISTIRNKVAGKINDIYYEEGQRIEQGKVLYWVETDSFEVEKNALVQEKIKLQAAYDDWLVLKECIEKEISIAESKTLFSKVNNEYHYRYLDYLSNINKLTADMQQKEKFYRTLINLDRTGSVSRDNLNTAKNNYQNAKTDLEIYTNKFLLEVQSNISNTEKNLIELKKRLKNVHLNIKDAVVRAPISGIVNVITPVNKGDLLQSGTKMLTIVPEGNEYYRIQIVIPNADIANVKVGQEVKYHFAALPHREYGELTGKIKNIGIDAKSNEKQNTSFYLVEATVENKPLYNQKGEQAWVKVGMQCKARIITKSKKILFFLLEKINLID